VKSKPTYDLVLDRRRERERGRQTQQPLQVEVAAAEREKKLINFGTIPSVFLAHSPYLKFNFISLLPGSSKFGFLFWRRRFVRQQADYAFSFDCYAAKEDHYARHVFID
jgi:hypothetical protein